MKYVFFKSEEYLQHLEKWSYLAVSILFPPFKDNIKSTNLVFPLIGLVADFDKYQYPNKGSCCVFLSMVS